MKKKSIVWFILFSSLLSLLAIIVSFSLYIKTPAAPTSQKIIITISPGMHSRSVASLLEKKNIITNKLFFSYLTLFRKNSNKIKAGEYQLHAAMTPVEVLQVITSGKALLHSVTIPEGYTFKEISELLSKKFTLDNSKFLKLQNNKELLGLITTDAPSLEGYLFPDTYFFPKGATETEIVKKLIATYKNSWTVQMRERMKEINFTENQIITLASLIEKETGQEDERPLISAVFHNRLKKNIRLQCDPTVIYALQEKFDGNIRRKDLSFDSPYNTYRYKGLPPGPIASPGLKSIKASLSPASVNYLYFVARKDGSHQFSKTLKEHNRAVRKYQLRKRKKTPR